MTLIIAIAVYLFLIGVISVVNFHFIDFWCCLGVLPTVCRSIDNSARSNDSWNLLFSLIFLSK